MQKDLLTKLTEYAGTDYYPFHMPGHKRNIELCRMENPYAVDITEIDGFDNLHDAQGILKDAMEEAAELYGAQETFFLVNGSSSGILAAICSCTEPGDEILIARNCHKSAYHALYLQNLRPIYLYPQILQGIQSEILPEDVEIALQKHSGIRMVMIVSPTYEGIVSDIEKIADLVHQAGCLLLVDEAHGAHFGFAEGFPETAVRLGADLVIQSVHKTLPAFTQTALLHIGRDAKIDRERLRRYLAVFQSSSPSYLLMAGIQKSLRIVKEQGDILFPELLENIAGLRRKTRHFHYIHIPTLKNAEPSKLIICIDEASGKNGHWLYRRLLEKYHLQMEMESLWYVLAMTGIADRKEGFERLAEALAEIDYELTQQMPPERGKEEKSPHKVDVQRKTGWKKTQMALPVFCNIREAADAPKRACPLEDAAGFAGADYIYLYPPGIPLLVPGEVFTEELISQIKKSLKAGLEVKGVSETGCVYLADSFSGGE